VELTSEYPMPQDVESEQSAVAGLLQGGPLVDSILAQVRSEDFYRLAHRQIVAAVEMLRDRRDQVNPLTVLALLEAGDEHRRPGDRYEAGMDYLRAVVNQHWLTDGISLRSAQTVREMAWRRGLITDAADIERAARDRELMWPDVVTVASDRLGRLVQLEGGGPVGLRSMREREEELDRIIERAAEGVMPEQAVRFGISTLDDWTRPLRDQRLIVGKGASGVGKTHLAVQTVMETAKALGPDDGDVLVFSFEGKGLYQQRALSWLSRVDSRVLRQGFDTRSEYGSQLYALLRKAKEVLRTLPLTICEDVANQAGIEARVRHHAETKCVALVVIDHWQIMQRRSGRRQLEEYEQAAYSWRDLADEYNLPVFILSQVSFNPATGTWGTKGSLALHEAAYLDLRLAEEKGNPPKYHIICDKARVTPYFAPLPVVFSKSTSRIAPLAEDREPKGQVRQHDN